MGLLVGAGLGGFLDGILLHQVLQWHQMLTSRLPPVTLQNVELNMRWDGFFHAGTWALTAAGLWLLWREWRAGRQPPTATALAGALLAGWGGFKLVEGLANHHLLGIHHVRHGPDELAWDLGFLVIGVLLAAGGAALLRGPGPLSQGRGS